MRQVFRQAHERQILRGLILYPAAIANQGKFLYARHLLIG
jgi:hypothetical protein